MRIDDQTLSDLAIFRPAGVGRSLFDLIDKTRSHGGSLVLAEMIRNPPSSREEILDIQSSVRFIHDLGLRFPDWSRALSDAARYAGLTWDVASNRSGPLLYLEAYWVSVRYREMLEDVRLGLRALQAIQSGIPELLRGILTDSSPVSLSGLAARIKETSLSLGELPGVSRGWKDLVLDSGLRKGAKDQLGLLLKSLYEMDALFAMAEATRTLGFSFPEILDTEEFLLEGEGLFHPFLESPVENPLRLGPSGPLLLLTGPNMAGKTTFLKSIGIAALLAHAGMGVPAKALRLGHLDALYSSISASDDIDSGLSHFMTEVLRIREVTEAAARGEHVLAVLDEVFRGTNLKDSIEASELVLAGLCRSRGSGFVVSTHVLEIAERLGSCPVVYAHFSGSLQDGRPDFDYLLRPGVSDQRLGLHLLRQSGIPELLGKISAANKS